MREVKPIPQKLHLLWILSKNILHNGNTRPWTTDVFNTMSPCLYQESMSTPWVHVYTISPCIYNESMSIPGLWPSAKYFLVFDQELFMPFRQKVLVFYDKYIIQLEQIQHPFKTNTLSRNNNYNNQLGLIQYTFKTKNNIQLRQIQHPVKTNTISS